MAPSLDAAALPKEQLTAAQILQNVAELGALIEEEAEETNRLQRLTDRVHRALASAGAYRIAFPREGWGGPEMRLDDQVRLIGSIAYHDASTAWNVMVLADSGFFAPQLAPESAREIYPGIDLATAGSTRPAGRAVKVEGGYKLTGHWSFGSGIRNAEVVYGGFYLYDDETATDPETDESGRPALHICYMPRDAVREYDAWYTTGLSGSGSTEYAVTDLFIPESWKYQHSGAEGSLDLPPLARHAGTIVVNQAGVALGIAARAIDEFRRVVERPSRTSSGSMKTQDPYVPAAYAHAVALHDAARAYALTATGEVSALLFAGQALTPEQEGRLMQVPFMTGQLCRQSVEVLLECLGSRSVLATLPFDRLYRDLSTAIRHGNFRQKSLEVAGIWMLGLPTPAHITE